jgi:hypothetical protein
VLECMRHVQGDKTRLFQPKSASFMQRKVTSLFWTPHRWLNLGWISVGSAFKLTQCRPNHHRVVLFLGGIGSVTGR